MRSAHIQEAYMLLYIIIIRYFIFKYNILKQNSFIDEKKKILNSNNKNKERVYFKCFQTSSF